MEQLHRVNKKVWDEKQTSYLPGWNAFSLLMDLVAILCINQMEMLGDKSLPLIKQKGL
jgi:hypothetical protein